MFPYAISFISTCNNVKMCIFIYKNKNKIKVGYT